MGWEKNLRGKSESSHKRKNDTRNLGNTEFFKNSKIFAEIKSKRTGLIIRINSDGAGVNNILCLGYGGRGSIFMRIMAKQPAKFWKNQIFKITKYLQRKAEKSPGDALFFTPYKYTKIIYVYLNGVKNMLLFRTPEEAE